MALNIFIKSILNSLNFHSTMIKTMQSSGDLAFIASLTAVFICILLQFGQGFQLLGFAPYFKGLYHVDKEKRMMENAK